MFLYRRVLRWSLECVNDVGIHPSPLSLVVFSPSPLEGEFFIFTKFDVLHIMDDDERLSHDGDDRVDDAEAENASQADDEELDEVARAELDAGELRRQTVIESGGVNASGGPPRARLPHERVTTPYLTKYERARILGTRAMQISHNAPVLVPLEGEVDPLIIAAKELRQRVLPIVVRRRLPDNTYEDWPINELEVEPDRVIDDRYVNV